MPTINIKTRVSNITTSTEGLSESQSGFKARISNFIRMFSTIDILNNAETFILGGQTFIGTLVIDILNKPIESINLPVILQFVIDQINNSQTVIRNGAMKLINNNGSCEISVSSPTVITRKNHGFFINSAIMFNSTESLPEGMVEAVPYYVLSDGYDVNSFQISETIGGAPVSTTSSGYGSQTCGSLFVLNILKNLNPVFVGGKPPEDKAYDLNGVIINTVVYQRKLRTLGYYDSYVLENMDYDEFGNENTLEELETYT